MGQKINPTGFRLSVSRDWASRWYANARNYPVMLNEDLRVREYLGRRLRNASVGRVVIERPAKNARITIHSARPGVVIGKKGEDIEQLKGDLQRLMGVPVHVNIEEIRKPEIDAQLIADSITQQLERRIMFRRAMKRAMQNAMRLGAQGIKIMSSGRLNGIEIARTEWYREGRVPLHTLRADIQYGVSTAVTTYGIIGVKVWVYKGDTLGRNDLAAAAEKDPPLEREERKQRKSPGPRTLPPGRPAQRRRPEGGDAQGPAANAGESRSDARADMRGDQRAGGQADPRGEGRGGSQFPPRGDDGADAPRPAFKRVRRAPEDGAAATGGAGSPPPQSTAGPRTGPGGAPGGGSRPGYGTPSGAGPGGAPGASRGPRPAGEGQRGGPPGSKGPGGGRSQ